MFLTPEEQLEIIQKWADTLVDMEELHAKLKRS